MAMAEEAPVFPIRLDLKQPFPETVDCGAPFSFTITLETASGCDLAGSPFHVTDEAGEIVARGLLPSIIRMTPESEAYDPRHGPVDMRDSAEITVTAPKKIGSFAWTFTLPEHVTGNIRHGAASLAIGFATKQHSGSLAVWHNPTPVAVGAMFRFKAGARCTAGCPLSGETIEVVNADGAIVAQAVLGKIPWQGTRGLYWTTVAVSAPAVAGHFRWSVRMVAPERSLPHGTPSPASFSFVAMNPPEHLVTIEMVEQETGAPIPNAQVRLGPHRAATDEGGLARFRLPGGDFKLMIRKEGREASEQVLKVDRDLELKFEAKAVPEKDPYSFYWKG